MTASAEGVDPFSPADMVKVARAAMDDWRSSKTRSAAESRAARMLAWAVGRLDTLGALDAAAAVPRPAGPHAPPELRLGGRAPGLYVDGERIP